MAKSTLTFDDDSAPRKKEISVAELKGRKLGRILVKLGRLRRDQIHEAIELQKSGSKQKIGEILIDLGYSSKEEIAEALAAQKGIATVDLESLEIDPQVIEQLPPETVEAYGIFPVGYDKGSNTLKIAMKDANNFQAVDDLRLLHGFNVETVLANPKQVDKFITQHYKQGGKTSLEGLVDEMQKEKNLQSLGGKVEDLQDLVDAADDNKVKRFVNLVLLQAIQSQASDIHFEPFEEEFKLRMRIDGVLYEMVPPPKHLSDAITSRLKVLSKLNISEKRVPQDGRIELTVGGQPVDLRVSTLPTMFGESVVMRVLDRSNVNMDLEQLGMRGDDQAVFEQLLRKPNGIVLVTGPTGSGKTTTLYAALSALNDEETKILTAEDPVEYDIDGLVQVQVNPDAGLTFGSALRSFLRQDPDVILVGEMRDIETAKIGIEAALTGHLVFSTLHTNDAPASIARLLDMGVEPFLITATVEGILAQRLVRRICTKCREAYMPTEEQLMELDLTPDDVMGREFYRGKGCDKCTNSGYKGRLALHEILVLDEELKELIMNGGTSSHLRVEARKRGMRTLRESGLLGIFDGMTTIDEVVRETVLEED